MKRALLVALVVLVSGGCGVLRSPNGPPTSAPVFASMRRGECLGPCPVYRLTIYTDGTVLYQGEENVRTTARREGHVEPAALDAVRAEFARVGWSTLGEVNHDDCTDQPRVELDYGGIRRVHNWGDRHAPEELVELEALIDDVTHSVRWVGDEEALGQADASYCY